MYPKLQPSFAFSNVRWAALNDMPLTLGTDTVESAALVEVLPAVELSELPDAGTWLKVERDGDPWRTKIVPPLVFCAKTTDFRRVLSDRMYVTPGSAA